jgi:glycosyltransferase involved in cell wall biosynthesis
VSSYKPRPRGSASIIGEGFSDHSGDPGKERAPVAAPSSARVDVSLPQASEGICLIGYRLTNLRDGSSVNSHWAEIDGPRHPHTGPGLAAELSRHGYEVVFSNQVGFPRLQEMMRRRYDSAVSLFSLTSARRFSLVIGYALMGAIQTVILTCLPGRRAAVVWVMLANPNPDGPSWRAAIRRRIFRAAQGRADAVVCGLRELTDELVKRGACDAAKVFYSPTGVDTAFFDPALARSTDAVEKLPPGSFLLSVGGASRDEQLLYDGARGSPLPVNRVIGDPVVVARVRTLMDETRGDRVLSGISFAQLRWLYSNCRACIFTSKLDRWQAAGSTALAEAMACGAICVCPAGGCIEREWLHLAREKSIDCPVVFYRPADSAGLAAALGKVLALGADERNTLKAVAREMAMRAFPVERSHHAIMRAAAAAGSATMHRRRASLSGTRRRVGRG